MTRSDRAVPISGVSGLAWPAVPRPDDVQAFALLFQLEQSEWWTPEALFACQLRQARELVVHAARHVPFYRDRLAALRELGPTGLTPALWHRLPTLTRAEVQDAGDRLAAPKLPDSHGARTVYATSGSTGRPVRIQGTELGQQFRRAVRLRGNLWHRRDLSAKVAAIQRLTTGQRRVADEGLRAGWAAGYPTGPLIYREMEGPIDGHLAWLAAEDPDILITYPTAARAFAERTLESGVGPSRLREVATQGEIVDDALRDLCRRAWGAEVIDQYATREIGVIAVQCPDHAHYHVQSEAVLVEVLDEAGAPCPPGGVGRVVVTPLHNFATPLIRYEVGDYAELGPPCDCGRGLPVIRRVLGRTRNMATLPSGERIFPRIDGAALQRIGPLRQIQMVQRRRDEIEVRLVATRELDTGELTTLRQILVGAFGHAFPMRLLYVAEIPRSPGGKYEDFRSELDG